MTHNVPTQDAVETWKLAHGFVLDVYRLTNSWPKEEHYGLIPKVRNSSVKIASNIVEGYARQNGERYMQHLTDSQAALEETKYSLLVARDLGYLSDQLYDRIMNDGEDLSERLNGLQGQLTGQPRLSESKTEPAPAEERKRSRLAAFWTWFKGDAGQPRQPRLAEPKVWAEDAPATNYLDEIPD